jgi:hypothetical protein
MRRSCGSSCDCGAGMARRVWRFYRGDLRATDEGFVWSAWGWESSLNHESRAGASQPSRGGCRNGNHSVNGDDAAARKNDRVPDVNQRYV